MEKKNLECSSAGDKRFSAFYAIVEYDGIRQSIEKHYQSVKRDAYDNVAGKGSRVAYIVLKGKRLSPVHLTAFYRYLWWIYFKENRDLLKYAKTFDTFTDKFRGKSINCQADVVQALVKGDREYFEKPVRALAEALKSI